MNAGRPRSTRLPPSPATLLAAFGLLSAALASCDAPDEVVEPVAQPATSSRIWPIHVRKRPNYQWDKRYMKVTCGERCVETRDQPTGRINRKTGEEIINTVCVRFVEDCDTNLDAVELFPTLARAEEGTTPFRAQDAYSGAVSEYRGCGPQAAMNYSAYVGTYLNIADAARLTGTWHIRGVIPDWAQDALPDKWLRIGSTPDQLKDGLHWVSYDAWNRYQPTVRNHTNLRDVKHWLLTTGHPVALLVKGGYHWQLCTGWRRGINDHDSFYVIDYVDRGKNGWRKGYELQFENLGGLPSALFGYDSYKDATMITFHPWFDPS